MGREQRPPGPAERWSDAARSGSISGATVDEGPLDERSPDLRGSPAELLASGASHFVRMGLAPEKVARLGEVADRAYRSIEVARDAGVAIASGSDVVGPWQGRRGEELLYKAHVLGAHTAIISATRTNAELFGLADRIGTIEAGKAADLILVHGEPLADISILADPANVIVVLKDGVVVKDTEGRAGG